MPLAGLSSLASNTALAHVIEQQWLLPGPPDTKGHLEHAPIDVAQGCKLPSSAEYFGIVALAARRE
jgi:hypothetical protein